MKYIHKIVGTLIIGLFLSNSLSAQKIGILAGYNLTGLQQSNYGTSGDFNYLNGFHIGVKLETKLEPNSDKYTISIGAQYEMRANRYDIGWYKPYTTQTRFLYYAVIPIDVTYRYPISDNINLLAFGGPRLNIGLYGLLNQHYYMSTQAQSKDYSPFGAGQAMNGLDFSFGLGTGIELERFQFLLGYDLPLTNSTNEGDPSVLKQHNFRFSIAYMINLEHRKKIIR